MTGDRVGLEEGGIKEGEGVGLSIPMVGKSKGVVEGGAVDVGLKCG